MQVPIGHKNIHTYIYTNSNIIRRIIKEINCNLTFLCRTANTYMGAIAKEDNSLLTVACVQLLHYYSWCVIGSFEH